MIERMNAIMARDPAFGSNGFGRPKIYSDSETLANGILNALLSKPGSYPSIPNMGMDVARVVFVSYEDIDTESIKNDLIQQCSYFHEVVQNGSFDVIKREVVDDNGTLVPMILFVIPTIVKNIGRRLIIGIRKNGIGISYNFSWID